MSDSVTKPSRTWRIVQACIGVVLLGIVIWAAVFFTGGHFREYVRDRIVSRLAQMTGGRVELREFKWNLSKLEFEATDLTIHGLEKPDEQPPYVHIDRLFFRAKIISLFQREIGLRQVEVQRPVVHIIVYPDGTTNQPKPKVLGESRDAVQSLFDLAIERADLRDGLLVWNERRIPLELTANDVSVAMSHTTGDKHYDGTIRAGKVDTAIEGLRPFASNVAIDVDLLPTRIQIQSLQWKSGRSRLQANGAINDFSDPKLSLTYSGSINLAELASVIRNRDVRGGTLDVQGHGTYSLADFASSGKLAIKGFEYQTSAVTLRDAAATADFTFNPDRIAFSHVVAKLLGGTAQGEASANNWITLPKALASTRNVSAKREGHGTAAFRVQAIAVGQIAQALSTSTLPLDRLNAAGATTGTVNGEWHGNLPDIRTVLDLSISPSPNPVPDQMPVEGAVRGTYNLSSQVFDIADLNLHTRFSETKASGTLGSASGNLKLSINASKISEFVPLLNAIRGPEPLPIDIGGSLRFTGIASGRFTQPTIQGHLELRDFVTVVPKPTVGAHEADVQSALTSTVPQQTQRIHWDALSGDVLYSPTRASVAHGMLRHGTAQVNVDASSELKNGSFEDYLPFTGRINIRGANIAELQSLVGYRYPVDGTLNANFQFGGTASEPRGNGHFSLTDANVYGQPVRSVSADFVLLHREAQLRNIIALSDSGELRGLGSYNFGSEAFGFDARGTNFNLANFRQLQMKRMKLEGIANFEAQGSGTLSEPVINAKLRVTKMLLNGERIGDLMADATTHGADLKVDAVSSFQNAALKLDGNVHLRGDFPAQIEMKFGDIDLNPVIKSYLRGRMTGHTTIAGTMILKGPLKRPRELNGELNVDRFLANVENVAIHNDGAIRASMANEQVRIEHFRLVGEQTHFIEASGTAQLTGAQRLNFKVAGKLNMKLLQTLSPDITAYGTSDFGVDVVGTLMKPQLNGRVQITDAGVSYIDLPNGLSGINGSLIFTQDRLQVESLTAKTGGGELVLGGFLTYQKALTFNLTARGRDIRLRYPPGISSTADANLTLSGTLKNSLLSGEITVTKFGLNPRFDFASYLTQGKSTQQAPTLEAPLYGLKFDVHVISTPELEVQTSLAKITGDVDLRLRGSAARPTILGRVNIVEGDVSFNGTQYHLERGDITFTNPVRIEPVLDLEATAHVRDYDITLGFHGPMDKLSTTYRSDPPLPTADIIALLALGRTREESVVQSMNSQQTTTTLTESASNALLGQALNATVSSRVQKLFGVSRIKIDPQVGGPENNPNARLTIEQTVSNKITLTYITNLSQSAQQIIQVEYNVNKNVSILGSRDQNGVVGFDVRIRQRKK